MEMIRSSSGRRHAVLDCQFYPFGGRYKFKMGLKFESLRRLEQIYVCRDHVILIFFASIFKIRLENMSSGNPDMVMLSK